MSATRLVRDLLPNIAKREARMARAFFQAIGCGKDRCEDEDETTYSGGTTPLQPKTSDVTSALRSERSKAMSPLQEFLAHGNYTGEEKFELAKMCKPIEEYLGNSEQLRNHGTSLESYVKGFMRDEDLDVVMPLELKSGLDRLQAAVGEPRDMCNPLLA